MQLYDDNNYTHEVAITKCLSALVVYSSNYHNYVRSAVNVILIPLIISIFSSCLTGFYHKNNCH